MTLPGCSVVVCTRNRAPLLRLAVGSVGDQSYPRDRLEILVVDNASADATRKTVEESKRGLAFPLHYHLEPRLGLSHARNAGLKEARGEIVLFLDDDAVARQSRWASTLVSVFEDPRVAAAGGDVEPIWPTPEGRPSWLPDALMSPLTGLSVGSDHVTRLRYPRYPCGGNFAVRRRLALEVGGFAAHLGRRGDSLLGGEESELFLRLERRGLDMVYVPGAAVEHRMHAERLTSRWLEHRAYAQGWSEALVERHLYSRLHLPSRLLRKLVGAAGGSAGHAVCSTLRLARPAVFCRHMAITCRAYLACRLGFEPDPRRISEPRRGHE